MFEQMSACELKAALETREVSNVDVLLHTLDRIAKCEPDVHAFLTVKDSDQLLCAASEIDRRRSVGGAIGPLSGLPIAVKDNISTRGVRTTCGSLMLERYLPIYDATVIERIEAADGLIIGKTNMDEFAMGSSGENSAFGVTRNPHDLKRVPGGTSSGSAAAVASREAVLALGADTGGSIRQPAALCGVVGIKPTYGRVSRYGLVAYGSSFDQIGPLGRTVRDAALLLNAIAGHDERDSTSVTVPVADYMVAAEDNTLLRVGVPREYFAEGLDDSVRASVNHCVEALRGDGCTIVPVSMPHTRYALATYYVVACAEAASNLGRYDGCRFGHRATSFENLYQMVRRSRSEGFGREVKVRILLGNFVLSSGYADQYYIKADRVRSLIRRDFKRAFNECDVIVHPTTPTPAFLIGEKSQDPLAMYLNDVYSVIASLAGVPAISVPCGVTDAGLPIGIQIVGAHFAETTIIAAAARIEKILTEAGIWDYKTHGTI